MTDQIVDRLRTAWQLQESEQWERMAALAAEARTLSEQAHFYTGVARALAIEAFVHYMRSDFRAALLDCSEALQYADGDPEAEGRARAVLALVHSSLGSYEAALRNSDRSIELLTELGSDIPKAFALAVKGGILLSVGQVDEALAWHQRSVEAYHSSPDGMAGKIRALSGLGLTYLVQKRFTEALGKLQEALALARERVTPAPRRVL